ncbi:MAG: LysM peptidoglycan-binding domain-containing protein [Chloroflexi bacterium]|nr:LysM peptidoglycan-binding domain-containing protein [Chloroflexota bacterium]
MPDSLLDFRDAGETIAAGVAETIAGIEGALRGGTYTARQLGNLRASLTGYRDDIVDLRAELDDTDVADFQLYEDGAVTIRLWQWERALRHSLVVLAPQVRAAETVATRLVAGRADQVYVSRSGDTLQRIAARFLGDWREWTRIADANGLGAGELPSGSTIVIPPRR